MSFFDSVPLLPSDPILGISALFAEDSRQEKVNLGIGAYHDEEGLSVVFSAVKKAEEILFHQHLDKEYLPIQGYAPYLNAVEELIYGSERKTNSIVILQTVGGEAALRIGSEFFSRQGFKKIYIPEPSWPNHLPTFQKAGLDVGVYPYYDYEKNALKFEEICQTLQQIPSKSVILLQAGCHNPTGMDFSLEQWKVIEEIVQKQQLIPFFDMAYQGFGVGVEEDAWPIRYFVSKGHEIFVASSFSKNMGLYGERVGSLSCYTHSEDTFSRLMSQFKSIVRGIYSSPPLHGGRLVATILASHELKKEWMQELNHMRLRIEEMRRLLMQKLCAKTSKIDFQFMNHQQGMFSLSGLSSKQVERLRLEKGIYMPTNGRISIPGLTNKNIDYVVDSIIQIV